MRSIESIKDRHFLAILSEVKTEVHKLFGDKLRQLILYGSYARDEQELASDIDIMVLVDGNEEELREYRKAIVEIMTDLSLKYDTFISLTRETHSRYYAYLDVLPYFQNIYNEGVEIYGQKTA